MPTIAGERVQMSVAYRGTDNPRDLEYRPHIQRSADHQEDSGQPLSFARLSRLPLHGLLENGESVENGVDGSAAGLQPEIDRLTLLIQQERAEVETRLRSTEDRARNEGRLAAGVEAEARLKGSLDRVDCLFRSLEETTRRYTMQVEREVVMLALDIARRVLRHESQVDRLLLAGAVRATLDSIREGGNVTLYVPQEDVFAWQGELIGVCFEGKQVVVEGDLTLKAGQCLCRLATGTLDLSWNSQVGEIERSFENILQRRELLEKKGPSAVQVTIEDETVV